MEKKDYILVIPDVHGRTFWEESVKLYGDDAKRVVFLGDYLDPYPEEFIKSDQAYENFLKIIEFAKSSGKTTLLLGNHDLHYIDGEFTRSTRYNYDFRKIYKKTYKQNKDLFSLAYMEKDILFTHAGVHPDWLRINKFVLPESNIDTWLNSLDLKYFGQVGRSRGGYFPVGSPVWADINEFDYITQDLGFHQIVGHTRSIVHRGEFFKDEKVTCLDCMGGFFLLYPEEYKIEEKPSRYLDEYKEVMKNFKERYF